MFDRADRIIKLQKKAYRVGFAFYSPVHRVYLICGKSQLNGCIDNRASQGG